MIVGKPTDLQLEQARDVIDWLVQHTKDNEPHATQFIAAGETFSEQMPLESDDL
jgi:hypothetical protein